MTTRARGALVTLLVATLGTAPARAQVKPDFSGSWILDAAKSDPAPPGAGGGGRGGAPATSLVIKQTPAEVSVTQGPQTVVYRLDGTETIGPPPGDIKNKASWEGDKLVLAMKREVFAGADYVTLTGREVYSLTAGVLTIERTPPQQKAQTRKLVYTKTP